MEFLDFQFRVEKFEAEFNENHLYPIVRGRAKTTIRPADTPLQNPENILAGTIVSGGQRMDLFITLYSISENGEKVSQGTWIDGEPNFLYELSGDQSLANFALESSGIYSNSELPGNQELFTNEQILELLGYSPGNVREKVTELAVGRVEQEIIDPLLRPINRTIRKWSGLDNHIAGGDHRLSHAAGK
ncbi:hypothetical protein ACFL6I_18360, partial [candidate division KSB1 bacterium]